MQAASHRKAFGPFAIGLDTGELWRDGRPIRIAPQPFQVLAELVVREGGLVTRDELRAAIWSDGTTVEFDQGLNFCIRQVRIALEDDARQPKYIDTVPKRGYRLLAPVTDVSIEAPAPSVPAVVEKRFHWGLTVALAAAGLLAIAGWAWTRESPRVPEDAVAHRLRLEAAQLAGTWEVSKVKEAASRYREAAGRDPSDARAWAGLANADVVLAQMQRSPDLLVEAERVAQQALDLDGSLADASAALAHSYWQQWRWREAGELFSRAVASSPNEAGVQQLYGLYLASLGHKDEAIASARRAVDLVPTSGLLNFSLAQVYLHTNEPAAALAQARHTLELDRHFPLAYRVLIRASLELGRGDEALQALADERRFVPDRLPEAWEPYLLARLGRAAEARRLLASNRKDAPLQLADVAALAALGDTDAALTALDAAVARRGVGLLWLKVTPELATLRPEPRFAGLLARMSLQ